MTSPIETQLIAAIRRNVPVRTWLWDYTAREAKVLPFSSTHPNEGWSVFCADDGYEPPRYGTGVYDVEDGYESISLYAQVKIDSYRADLVISSGCGLVLLECDGHDFHERTKQQAMYDRNRDRFFMAQGVMTARFTGSEIVNYPEKCCDELFAILSTARRVGSALSRNGFNIDGNSFRNEPTHADADHPAGFRYRVHWNPGRDT